VAELVVIAAVAEENRVIGDGLDLPWRIPEDLRRFKRLTSGHPVIMGRRTFESLLHQFGGPLSGRDNVVLTRHPMHTDHANVHVYSSLDAALGAFAGCERIFIGGGASVYEAALPLADRLELTLVEGTFSGDTHFPPYEHLIGPVFERSACEAHPAAEGRPGFRFETFLRLGRER
jgi:dihydrofolate reductase